MVRKVLQPAKRGEISQKTAERAVQAVKVKGKLKITYKGELDTELDGDIIAALRKIGYEFQGSGYNMNTNVRDISLEKQETKTKAYYLLIGCP